MADVFKGSGMQSCSKSATGAGWNAQEGANTTLLRTVFDAAWERDAVGCLGRTAALDDANIRFVVGAWLQGDAVQMKTLVANIGNISEWDMRNVTDLSNIFNCAEHYAGGQKSGCQGFDDDIGRWDVSGVTSLRSAFRGAAVFNQNLANWRVGKVVDMFGAFTGASDFDQNLAAWQVTNVASFVDAFSYAGGLGSCNRRALTDAPSWRGNAAFLQSVYMEEWSSITSCASWAFVPAVPHQRLPAGADFHPYGRDNYYVTNKPYQIAPLVADSSKTKVTNGEVRPCPHDTKRPRQHAAVARRGVHSPPPPRQGIARSASFLRAYACVASCPIRSGLALKLG